MQNSRKFTRRKFMKVTSMAGLWLSLGAPVFAQENHPKVIINPLIHDIIYKINAYIVEGKLEGYEKEHKEYKSLIQRKNSLLPDIKGNLGELLDIENKLRKLADEGLSSLVDVSDLEEYIREHQVTEREFMNDICSSDIVIMGEEHKSYDQRLDELAMIKALEDKGKPIAVGLEALGLDALAEMRELLRYDSRMTFLEYVKSRSPFVKNVIEMGGEYTYDTKGMDKILAYIRAKNLPVIPLEAGLLIKNRVSVNNMKPRDIVMANQLAYAANLGYRVIGFVGNSHANYGNVPHFFDKISYKTSYILHNVPEELQKKGSGIIKLNQGNGYSIIKPEKEK